MYPLYALPSMLSLNFTSDFWFYDRYYIIVAYILLYHLCSIPPVSCSYLTMSIPYLISLAIYLPTSVCLSSRDGFQCMFTIRIYRYTCAYLCSPLGIHITTRRRVLTPLDPYIQVSEFGACGFFRILIRVAQLKSESPAVHLKPYLSRPPCASLEFFFCKLVSALCTTQTCTSSCILAFALIVDVILL